MLSPVFKSPKHQRQFERFGYLYIPKLIPLKAIDKLKELYFRYEKEHSAVDMGMHSTVQTNNYEIVRHINSEMQALTSEYADRYLTNYKFYLGNFIVKESRDDSELEMHQDWTCVDEPKYCSFNFWIDLDGRGKNSGQFFFLKGTHHLREGLLRFAPIGLTPWEDIRAIAPMFYTYVNTEPGDVIFLNNAILHGSGINKSGKRHIAAVLGAYSSDASLLHYYLEPGSSIDKIERHLVSTENFISMPRGKRPPGSKFDNFVTYDTPRVTKKEFVYFMMNQLSLGERLSIYGRKIKDKCFSNEKNIYKYSTQ